MKVVIFLGIFLIGAVLAIDGDEDDFKCKVGVHYEENKCNGCMCDVYGLGCTLMACTSHQDPKIVNCEKGTTWNEGCEQCWCTRQGTICTTHCGKVHERPKN